MTREKRRAARARSWKRSQSTARGAAALALACVAVALPARAQNTPVPAPETPAATPDAPPLPELAYDAYFEPFTDNPLYRLHDPEPLTAPPPLFQKFDPLEGLSRPAKVSRVALPGERYVVYAPVMNARVGEEITVPISVRDPISPMTSLRVFLDYDPAVIVPTGTASVGIPSEDMMLNARPDPSYVGDCTNCLIAFNVLTYPWDKPGPFLNLTFRVVAPGVSPMAARLVEISDNGFEMRSTVFQDGIVRVEGAS